MQNRITNNLEVIHTAMRFSTKILFYYSIPHEFDLHKTWSPILTIVCFLRAGTPPSNTKIGLILKYNNLQTL